MKKEEDEDNEEDDDTNGDSGKNDKKIKKLLEGSKISGLTPQAGGQMSPEQFQQQMEQMKPLVDGAQNLLETFERSGMIDLVGKLSNKM